MWKWEKEIFAPLLFSDRNCRLCRIMLEIIVDLNEKCKKLIANYNRQSIVLWIVCNFVPSYVFVAHVVKKEIGVTTFTAITGTLTDNLTDSDCLKNIYASFSLTEVTCQPQQSIPSFILNLTVALMRSCFYISTLESSDLPSPQGLP